MDDLAAALLRLPHAFPDDPGPAADPFTLKDRFETFIWYGSGGFDDFDHDEHMRIWTPRILRLLTSGQLRYSEAQAADRFREAGWPEWPPARRTAVEDVLRAWWTATITEHPSPVPVTDVLAVVSYLSGDVELWLSTWSATSGVAAARQLSDLLRSHVPWSRFMHDFDGEAAEDALWHWLRRHGVDLLAALPPGAAQDAALAELAERESMGPWWL
ncbi:hypothetical protein ABZ345_23610 [Lentzea sp. NPDC005914]|uniref:hypothetical protein n=1 Tax=Lentzea sp. NPDC005914 TaxID=3154572 RepID=UPI0033D41D6E